jgi:hypothetical protein
VQWVHIELHHGPAHKPGAKLSVPMYLEAAVKDQLAARAKARGIEIDPLVGLGSSSATIQ